MRVKLLWITYALLPALLFSPRWRRTVSSEIPEDAEVLSVHDDPASARVCIRFTHPSFPQATDGHAFRVADPPQLDVMRSGVISTAELIKNPTERLR